MNSRNQEESHVQVEFVIVLTVSLVSSVGSMNMLDILSHFPFRRHPAHCKLCRSMIRGLHDAAT